MNEPTSLQQTTEHKGNSLLVTMASKFSMEPAAFANAIKKTCMPSDATNEQFAAFLMVAREYDLNPLVKEIYAFPQKGGIQPIVGVDGWVKIMNSHPQFNGLKFEYERDDAGHLTAVKAIIHRKDRDHPIEITEYMDECRRGTEPWKNWPSRMLRHKAMIQCCRIAMGYTNIVEPDEYERRTQADIIDVTASATVSDLNEKIKAAGVTVDQETGEITRAHNKEAIAADTTQLQKLIESADSIESLADCAQEIESLDHRTKEYQALHGLIDVRRDEIKGAG